MAKSITTKQLTIGSTYLVGGNIAFSRLARQTTPEETARENQRRAQAGISPIGSNYTTATIYNAEIYYADPNAPTMEERYAQECMYVSKSSKNYTGNCFTGMNKGNYLPRVYLKDQVTGEFNEITLEKELANDTHVTLVMKVFKGSQANPGVSLESVLIDDTRGLRYYESNNDLKDSLRAKGIVLNDNGAGPRKASDGIPATANDPVDIDHIMPDDANSIPAPTQATGGNPYAANNAPYSTGNAFSATPAPAAQPPVGNAPAPGTGSPFGPTTNATPGTGNPFGPGTRTY